MTDFIAAYDAEINAALDEQGKAFTVARDRFAERAHAAEINLIAAMTHRGRLYVAGPAPEKRPDPTPPDEAAPTTSGDTSGLAGDRIEPETPYDVHS